MSRYGQENDNKWQIKAGEYNRLNWNTLRSISVIKKNIPGVQEKGWLCLIHTMTKKCLCIHRCRASHWWRKWKHKWIGSVTVTGRQVLFLFHWAFGFVLCSLFRFGTLAPFSFLLFISIALRIAASTVALFLPLPAALSLISLSASLFLGGPFFGASVSSSALRLLYTLPLVSVFCVSPAVPSVSLSASRPARWSSVPAAAVASVTASVTWLVTLVTTSGPGPPRPVTTPISASRSLTSLLSILLFHLFWLFFLIPFWLLFASVFLLALLGIFLFPVFAAWASRFVIGFTVLFLLSLLFFALAPAASRLLFRISICLFPCVPISAFGAMFVPLPVSSSGGTAWFVPLCVSLSSFWVLLWFFMSCSFVLAGRLSGFGLFLWHISSGRKINNIYLNTLERK